MSWSSLSGLTVVARAVPVDPDAPTARRWLQEELTDPIYHQGPGLIERIMGWIQDFLGRLLAAGQGVGGLWLAVIVMAVVALVAGVAFYVAGPVRRARRVQRSAEVLGTDVRAADQLRGDAQGHADAGRWDEAVLDRFRAIVRSLEERAVLDERPGRTADETAREAQARFPAHAQGLDRAAGLFDDVYYGDRAAGPEGYRALAELDASLRGTRPSSPAAGIGQDPGVGAGPGTGPAGAGRGPGTAQATSVEASR